MPGSKRGTRRPIRKGEGIRDEGRSGREGTRALSPTRKPLLVRVIYKNVLNASPRNGASRGDFGRRLLVAWVPGCPRAYAVMYGRAPCARARENEPREKTRWRERR